MKKKMEIENFTAHRIKCTNELRNIKMHRGRLAKENLSLKDENIQLKAKLQHETAYEDLERERTELRRLRHHVAQTKRTYEFEKANFVARLIELEAHMSDQVFDTTTSLEALATDRKHLILEKERLKKKQRNLIGDSALLANVIEFYSTVDVADLAKSKQLGLVIVEYSAELYKE